MRLIAWLILASTTAAAAEDPVVFFESRIRPLLAERCYACHAATVTSGLRLDSREALLKGGSRGPAIVPRRPEESLLLRAVSHADERLKMPPTGRLGDQEIRDLKTWVEMGAPWPANSKTPAIKPGQRDWWSFQPLKKPGGSIDSLINARLAKAGLKPVGLADPRTLLRRATFDLIGLPPAPSDVDAFLSDRSPDAFARAVDRLLASPHFGERWARYWLDIARYAEDDVLGLSQESYPNAWRYRDWVVQAFNHDLPYTLFIKGQLAADQLEIDAGMSLLPGLGFLGLGPWYYTVKPPAEARADERHDRVDVVSRGFLGLTVACARCHDHKFDPITTADYYGLAGVFGSTEYQEYPLAEPSAVKRYEEHQKKIKDTEKEIKEFVEGVSRQLAEMMAHRTARYVLATRRGDETLNPEIIKRWTDYLKRTEHDHPFLAAWKAARSEEAAIRAAEDFQSLVLAVIKQKKEVDEENKILLAATKPRQKSATTKLPNGYETYDEFCPGCQVAVKSLERDRYMLWNDLFRYGGKKSGGLFAPGEDDIDKYLSGEWKTHLAGLRGRLENLKKTAPEPYAFLHGVCDKAAPANLKIHVRGSPYNLGGEAPRRFIEVLGGSAASQFRNGSGRLELAEAIAAHPLAARVAANRIWAWLTGSFIVDTPSNFGRLGAPPSNPELLEFLAARLVEHGGRFKPLIRDIMLSDAYRRASTITEVNAGQDADNRLYWRANRRRLDAEALRDSILYVAGSLEESIGGPSVDLATDQQRRTLYGKVSRFRLNDTLALFDFPAPSITSEKRNVTNVPVQRLFFLNSVLMVKQSAVLAERLNKSAPDDLSRLRLAHRLLYGREATAADVRLGTEYLKTADWNQYAQVLLSANEFLFID